MNRALGFWGWEVGFSRLSSLRSLSGEVQGLRVASFTGSGLRVWDVGVVWRSSNENFLDGSKMCFGDFVVFRDRMFGQLRFWCSGFGFRECVSGCR